jgi:class 3 adenylate cyclase/CHAT domain-containing protein
MDENKTDIDAILAEKVKIERLLESQFKRKITIMFTDIKGSTSYFADKGDLEGRTMIHIHNAMLLPVIQQHDGVLIKTIGDATMSVYDKPMNALMCAQEIQSKLKSYNKNKPEQEQIHVKIGLNYGTGIVEKTDVYGDIVNVASRMVSLAEPDEILMTEELYRESRSSDDLIFRYVDTMKVRGKKEDISVYRLIWHEEDLCLGKTRSSSENLSGQERVFVLEVSVSGQKLKVSGFEKKEGEEKPLKTYSENPFNNEKITSLTKEIIEHLNNANKRGKVTNETLIRLKNYGRTLFDELIPKQIREKLIDSTERNLLISIDDKLVHIPWELLHDGRDFLCQKFSIGRSVSTKQLVSSVARAIGRPLKTLILADPEGDLNASREEGLFIHKEIGRMENWIDVTLKTSDITQEYVKTKMRNFDIVHYAGHAEYNASSPDQSGWLLKDGKLSAKAVTELSGIMPMPALVFSNACQSGHTEEWKIGEDYGAKIFGLANAFLLSGVQHYIGTFWEIPDETGYYFAVHFYKNLIQGNTIGESLRLARHALIQKYGEDTIVWASYVLYGDPMTKYIQIETETQKLAQESPSASEQKTQEVKYQAPLQQKSYKNMVLAGIGLLIVAIVAVIFINWKAKTSAPDSQSTQISSTADQQTKKAETQRIDALVASLAQQYKENKFPQKVVDRDTWSSRPLTMVIMDIKSPDVNSSEKLGQLLNKSLQAESRINLVEREILDKLLQELKLSTSALADPMTSLKLGKLLSARFIITGSIIPDKNNQTIVLRFIDTETTAIKKVISAETSSKEIDSKTIDRLGAQIIEWVKTEYPMKEKRKEQDLIKEGVKVKGK